LITKEEADNFLRSKGYAKSTVQWMSSVIRMLDRMGIRTKEEVWQRFYKYSAKYRRHLYGAIVLTEEMEKEKKC
jgi:phosphoglucomutase